MEVLLTYSSTFSFDFGYKKNNTKISHRFNPSITSSQKCRLGHDPKGGLVNQTVKIRIYDRDDHHLQDISLLRSEAVFISPGKYLSDYDWAALTSIENPLGCRVLSVGTAHEGLRDVSSETDYPWLSIWVDAI